MNGARFGKEEMDALAAKCGGQNRLATTVARRIRELSRGATPLVETESADLVDVALEEIQADKVEIRPEPERREPRAPRGPREQGGRPPRKGRSRRPRRGRR